MNSIRIIPIMTIRIFTILFRFRSRFRHSLFHMILFHHLFFFIVASSAPSDSDFLLRFKDSLKNKTSLEPTWRSSTAPCSGRTPNWAGILCNKVGQVSGLKLENMSLNGLIDVFSLRNLSQLRSLSLMNNDFEGPLPDVGQLGSLKSLYLSGNNFSGEVDSAVFLRMMSLKKVHLANNRLEGLIPVSLALLPKLMELRLEGNRFEGPVPNFGTRAWLSFNVSNNLLRGRIPASLKAINATSFYGNKGLCGEPLAKCSASKSSILSVVVVGIVVLMALSAIGAVVMILFRFSRTQSDPEEESKTEQDQDGNQAATPLRPRKSAGESRLWFVREDRERFNMQELLAASAEILGSGSLGSTYKAALAQGGPVVAVKRFKQMNNVAREEFQEHMNRLGRLRHPNVLPLLAFYFKREEKLLISDFVGNYSLAFLLHGGGGERSARLDAEMRLNIVKGVAMGLKYLQEELPGVMAAHGNLKASNVLLKEQSYQPALSDYSLIPLINQEYAQQNMAAYKCPEYVQHGRITKKTDVWCLGLLILEIVTGKRDDLVSWVKSTRDQDELFDRDLVARSDVPTLVMLRKLLRVGMECCESDLDKRLDLKEALHKIENLRDHRQQQHGDSEIRPALSDRD